jgi:hypothetical protein
MQSSDIAYARSIVMLPVTTYVLACHTSGARYFSYHYPDICCDLDSNAFKVLQKLSSVPQRQKYCGQQQ